MNADMGGTDILSPLKKAQLMELPSEYNDYNKWLKDFSNGDEYNIPMKHVQKRIFLLTDG